MGTVESHSETLASTANRGIVLTHYLARRASQFASATDYFPPEYFGQSLDFVSPEFPPEYDTISCNSSLSFDETLEDEVEWSIRGEHQRGPLRVSVGGDY